MILGCQNDYLDTPMGHLHKQEIGIGMVIVDIVAILVMTYFLGKITEMNEEYLVVMDRLQFTLEDYTIKIANLKVDKFS